MFSKGSIENYLDNLASRKPAPGGGSAAALVGAAGAACMAMTCEFTLGREKYKKYEKEVRAILNFAKKARNEFLKLLDEDIASYKKVESVLRLTQDTENQIKARARRLQRALKQATIVPYKLCKLTHEGMKLASRLAKIGNKNLLCDTYASALFFDAAFWVGLANIKENLTRMNDENYVAKIKKDVTFLVKYMEDKKWRHSF